MQTVKDIRNYFLTSMYRGNFTRDRTGCSTIELIGASFEADQPSIFGTPNKEYIQKEIDWYDSESLNIHHMDNPPKQWVATAGPDGAINSNYGWMLYSKANHEQYLNLLQELIHNPDSRRACAVYNRPCIWHEYNMNGRNDFICTNAVTYYIRDTQLISVVQMRSNDAVYGYKNDYAWQAEVCERLMEDYNNHGNPPPPKQLESYRIIWQVQNLHVYERHFHLIK